VTVPLLVLLAAAEQTGAVDDGIHHRVGHPEEEYPDEVSIVDVREIHERVDDERHLSNARENNDRQTNNCAVLSHDVVYINGPLSVAIFTARRYASAVFAVVVYLSLCLSVRLSVTSRYCIETTSWVLTWRLPSAR